MPVPSPLLASLLAKLEPLRDRLIDISLRNRLLNYKDSGGKNLRLLPLDLDTLYSRLVDGGAKFEIQGTPQPKEEAMELPFENPPPSLDESTLPSRKPGVWPVCPANVANILDETGPDCTADAKRARLRAPDSPAKTEKRLATLQAQYKDYLEAFGSNFMYLAIGFLEWTDPDRKGEEMLYAPLVLIPVHLAKSAREAELFDETPDAAKSGRPARIYKYTLSYEGEDVIDNAALRLKLGRLPSGPQWPEFESEDEGGVNAYFQQIEKLLRQLPHELAGSWRIVRVARLAFFSSAKEAMYRDLDPAKWPTTNLVENEWISAALDGRDKTDNTPVSDEDVIRALYDEPIPTVVDADSSQMKTLVRIARGDSLVVQGPPGTGKSQTITNIIAAAIGDGKTVLFMSEKLAALEVVRARLGKVGLGAYCLELHSAKATPKEVLAQVGQRLRHSPQPAETPNAANSRMTRLNSHRLALSKYGQALAYPLPELDEVMGNAIWQKTQARDALEAAEPGLAEQVPRLINGQPPTMLGLDLIKDVLRTAARLVCDGAYAASRPWHGVCPRHFPGETITAEIRRILVAATTSVHQWQEALAALPCADSWTAGKGALHKRWAAGLGLPNVSSLTSTIVRRIWERPEEAAAYREYLVQMRLWRDNGCAYARRWSEQIELTDEQLHTSAALASQPISGLGSGANWGELLKQGADLTAVVASLQKRQEFAESLAQRFSLSTLVSIVSQGSRLARLAEEVAALSDRALHHLSPALLRPGAPTALRSAKLNADTLRETFDRLNQTLDLDRLPETGIVEILLNNLRKTQDSLLRWIPGTNAQRVRRELTCWMRPGQNTFLESDVVVCLETAIAWRRVAAEFRENADYKTSLGPGFAGLDTDWTALEESIEATHRLLEALGAENAIRVVEGKENIVPQSAILHELAAKVGLEDEVIARLLPRITSQPLDNLREMATATILDDLSRLKNKKEGILTQLQPLGLSPEDRLDAIPALCQQTHLLRGAKRRIAKLTADPGFLGTLEQGLMTTDLTHIELSLQWSEAVLSLEMLPPQVKHWLMEEDQLERAMQLQKKLQAVSQAVILLQSSLARIEQFCVLESSTAALASHDLDRTAAQILSSLQDATDTLPCLPAWYQLRQAERAIDSHHASAFWEWAKNLNLSAGSVEIAATLAFWHDHLLSISDQHPEMMNHHRIGLEDHGSQFAEIDRSSAKANLALIDQRAFRYRYDVAPGQHRGSPKSYTEMALLEHEMPKQRRHATVRRLVRQTGIALRELMPCWMMGPQAIAQFIEPEAFTFDLLVIDEASQVRPEDALGALARAKQIVIVGDSKQMPPSNNFMALGDFAEDENEDDGREPLEKNSAALQLDSILDTLTNKLSSEKLLWHYRSLHQSLIAFSNENFYDKELIIPPSRWQDNPELGVRWHFVEDGRFQARRNPAEAQRVITLMAEHVRAAVCVPENVRESLGVVAMNSTQQDHLREEWEELCRQDPDLDDARAEFEKSESLFIRNLENVQGDERDVIIVSVTYDNTSQRFGLINRAGGERRLNVLFTRARRRLHLFCSLKGSDVRVDLSEESGKGALRRYLQFAETGHLPDTGLGKVKNVPDSPFEESVARAIQGLGLELHFQVGVAGFRIDIGVMHPDHPGEYICGIECDGATYHSHPIARDRDRIRQEVLEQRGWKIYRIWSTDWFRSRGVEIERLRQYLISITV